VIGIWLPTEFPLELACIDRLSNVVARAIGDAGDQLFVGTSVATELEIVHDPAEFVHQVEVPHLICSHRRCRSHRQSLGKIRPNELIQGRASLLWVTA